MKRLYLDLETTSRNPLKTSLNPWHNCWPYSAAWTWDDHPEIYYMQADDSRFNDTITNLLESAAVWVNHNIKYDMHVCGSKIPDKLQLFDTVTMAKLIDSERLYKGGYGLDILARDWLNDPDWQWEKKIKPYLHKNKDYGQIPHDILSVYAKRDIEVNRRLDLFIQRTLPQSCYAIKNIEKDCTRSLYKIEQLGFTVGDVVSRAIDIQQELLDIIVYYYDKYGFYVEPHVPNDCRLLICEKLGLPVLGWTAGGKPAFDKKTLKKYPRHLDIDKLLYYRSLSTFKSGFIIPAVKYAIDDIIHPTFSQLVRTGRMSCKQPNLQAMSKYAKALIKPRKEFVCCDFCIIGSQKVITAYGDKTMKEVVEQKLPVLGYPGFKMTTPSATAYIGKMQVYNVLLASGDVITCTADHGFEKLHGGRINCKDLQPGDRLAHVFNRNHMVVTITDAGFQDVYTLTNPDMHNYITSEGLINFNSQIEFRLIVAVAGETEAIKAYNEDPYIDFHNMVAKLAGVSRTDAKTLNFAVAYGQGERSTVKTLSEYGYDLEYIRTLRAKYFDIFSKIVPCSRRHDIKCRMNGYSENLYGRRRHLYGTDTRKAFNSVIQGTAADIMKEGLNKLIAAGYQVVAVVHDEVLIEVDADYDIREIARCLEQPSIELAVPLKIQYGASTESWLDAKKEMRFV